MCCYIAESVLVVVVAASGMADSFAISNCWLELGTSWVGSIGWLQGAGCSLLFGLETSFTTIIEIIVYILDGVR